MACTAFALMATVSRNLLVMFIANMLDLHSSYLLEAECHLSSDIF